MYNYHYSLSNPSANVGKHRFRVRAPVCDGPDLPSCLRKNHSVADQCSGHALVSTSHLLLLVSMYNGGRYPKVAEITSWITPTHHARAEIENSEKGEMSNMSMLSPWEICNSPSWNLDGGAMIKDANIHSTFPQKKLETRGVDLLVNPALCGAIGLVLVNDGKDVKNVSRLTENRSCTEAVSCHRLRGLVAETGLVRSSRMILNVFDRGFYNSPGPPSKEV